MSDLLSSLFKDEGIYKQLWATSCCKLSLSSSWMSLNRCFRNLTSDSHENKSFWKLSLCYIPLFKLSGSFQDNACSLFFQDFLGFLYISQSACKNKMNHGYSVNSCLSVTPSVNLIAHQRLYLSYWVAPSFISFIKPTKADIYHAWSLCFENVNSQLQ